MSVRGIRGAAAVAASGIAMLAAALAPAGAAMAAPGAGGRPAAAAGSIVVAWGDNSSGKLGSNSVGELGNGKKADSKVPVAARLPAGTKVTAVRAGCGYNLVLTAAGRVLAWGQNPADVQLALAAPAHRIPAPVKFPAGTKVTAISAGTLFALALTSKGLVYAWGGNDDGQLGTGTRKGSHVPVRVRLPGGVKITAVAAGQSFALARTAAGGLLAWGANFDGQLGTGRKGGISKIPVRVRLPAGSKVQGLFAGTEHVLALTAAGTVLSWGFNGDGELGDGTTTDRSRPVRVRFPVGTKITAISAGSFHSLARDSLGHVLAWGENNVGELGNDTGVSSSLPVPVLLPANTSATAIGSGPGARSSFAILRAVM